MNIRAVPFPHIRNARDLGGLFGADGRRIRRGCLLRSAHLGEAQEADEQLLRETWRLRKAARDGLRAQKSEKARAAYRQAHESDFIIADGKTYAKGEAVLVLTTDADGTAATKADEIGRAHV